MKRNRTRAQIKDLLILPREAYFSVIPTFAFSRTKATAFVGRGWALVDGYCLHKALTAWNFTVNLIR